MACYHEYQFQLKWIQSHWCEKQILLLDILAFSSIECSLTASIYGWSASRTQPLLCNEYLSSATANDGILNTWFHINHSSPTVVCRHQSRSFADSEGQYHELHACFPWDAWKRSDFHWFYRPTVTWSAQQEKASGREDHVKDHHYWHKSPSLRRQSQYAETPCKILEEQR